MDSKLLLISGIMLLYRESQVTKDTDTSSELVKDVIVGLQLPSTIVDGDTTANILISLRSTILWMTEQPKDHIFDKDNLLQRIRINTLGDDSLYNVIVDGLGQDVDEETTRRRCLSYRAELKAYLNKNLIKEAVKEIYSSVLWNNDEVDWSRVAKDIQEKVEPFVGGLVQKDAGSLVTEIDLENIATVSEQIEEGQQAMSTEGIIKTPYQGLNRMCGDNGGLRRGNSVLIGALQHNFKSGLLLNITKGAALYNDPFMYDETKQPLIVFITLENEVVDNILIMYKNMVETETGVEVDIKQVDPNVAATYVKERLMSRGYRVKMLRFDPSDFTYRDLIDLLNGYIAEGYEIHLLVIDYLNKMSKSGCVGANMAGMIKDLFSKIRNYTSPKQILFVTAHQLSSDAKFLLRQGVENFTHEVVNKGYYDECKGVDQEVDQEICIFINKPGDGHSYLEMHRGKHRKSGAITPERDLYTVYKFEPVGEIPDDVEGKDQSRKSVGGGIVGDGDGDQKAWWDG